MKVAVEVKDRNEADAVKRAMEDPTARATVIVIGVLLGLPSARARQRAMTFVRDRLDEEAEGKLPPGQLDPRD